MKFVFQLLFYIIILILVASLQLVESASQVVNIASIYGTPDLIAKRVNSLAELLAKVRNEPYMNGHIYGELMWLDEVNGLGGIPIYGSNNSRYEVNITYFNSPLGNSEAQQDLANTIINGTYGRFHVLLLSLVDMPSIYALSCDLSESCLVINGDPPAPSDHICSLDVDRTQLPSDCSNRGRKAGERRFDSYFSVATNPEDKLSIQMGLLYQQKVRRLGFIFTANELDTVIYRSARSAAQNLQFRIEYMEEIALTDGTVEEPSSGAEISQPWSSEDVRLIVQQLIDNDVEALFFIASSPHAPISIKQNLVALLSAFEEFNWLPKVLHISSPIILSLASNSLQYSYTDGVWDKRLRSQNFRALNATNNLELYNAEEGQDSSQVFVAKFLHNYPQLNNDLELAGAAENVAKLVLLQKLIEKTGSISPLRLIHAAKYLSVPSHWGLLRFDSSGRKVSMGDDNLLYQLMNNGAEELRLQPILPQSIGSESVFPMPTYSERKYNPQQYFYSTRAEWAVAWITAVSMLIIVVLAGITIHHREHAVFKAASPLYLILFLLGGLCLLSSNYFALPLQSAAFCTAQIWCLTLGFTLMFSALFMKTLRIYILCSASKLDLVRISDLKLLVPLIAILGLDFVLNIVWQSSNSMQTVLVVVDTYRPLYNYEQCSATSTGLIFVYISLALKCILILCGLILTVMSREVVSAFNETVFLSGCIYSVTIVCALFVPIIATNAATMQAIYIIRCAGVLFLVMSCVILMYLTKLSFVFSTNFVLTSFVTHTTQERLHEITSNKQNHRAESSKMFSTDNNEKLVSQHNHMISNIRSNQLINTPNSLLNPTHNYPTAAASAAAGSSTYPGLVNYSNPLAEIENQFVQLELTRIQFLQQYQIQAEKLLRAKQQLLSFKYVNALPAGSSHSVGEAIISPRSARTASKNRYLAQNQVLPGLLIETENTTSAENTSDEQLRPPNILITPPPPGPQLQ
jgi:hypothetical protein